MKVILICLCAFYVVQACKSSGNLRDSDSNSLVLNTPSTPDFKNLVNKVIENTFVSNNYVELAEALVKEFKQEYPQSDGLSWGCVCGTEFGFKMDRAKHLYSLYSSTLSQNSIPKFYVFCFIY